jgi:hypothetical protein
MKNSSNREIKNRAKIPPKITKIKTLQHKIGDDLTQKHDYIDTNQEFTRCGNHHNILTLWRIEGISHFLSFPLLHNEAHPHLSKMQLCLGGGRGVAECLPLHQPLGSYL